MKYNHTGNGLLRHQWDVADHGPADGNAPIFSDYKGEICRVNLEQPEAEANIQLILAAGDMLDALRHITKQYMVECALRDNRSPADIAEYHDIVCVKEAIAALKKAGYDI